MSIRLDITLLPVVSIQQQLGGDFRVEDRYEQQADTYRIMRVEKLISYLFLTFILVIAF